MNPSTADYEQLLREAIQQAKAAAPRASDDAVPRASEDLVRCSSKATEAVARVTNGAASLKLVPRPLPPDVIPTYQLQLRQVGSEAPPSDLGVYRLSLAGYPIQRWHSWTKWLYEPHAHDDEFRDLHELEAHFEWMISKPESRLVILVAFFQQQAATSAT
jgi:hypothetical protein